MHFITPIFGTWGLSSTLWIIIHPLLTLALLPLLLSASSRKIPIDRISILLLAICYLLSIPLSPVSALFSLPWVGPYSLLFVFMFSIKITPFYQKLILSSMLGSFVVLSSTYLFYLPSICEELANYACSKHWWLLHRWSLGLLIIHIVFYSFLVLKNRKKER